MWNNRPSQKGLFIVMSGPSGTGKTSVIKALCKDETTLEFSISATTRPPRSDEIDRVDYYFLGQAEFEDLIDRGGFLEWVKYGGHYYGTLKSTIELTIEKGKDLILEIDVHGANEGKRSRYPVYQHLSLTSLPRKFREAASQPQDRIRFRTSTTFADRKIRV